MSGPLKLPIQLPPQPRYVLHQATLNRTLRMDVVSGVTHVLRAENEDTTDESLYWKRVREEDGSESGEQPE